jgi:ribbon-helix-helix CopG family protein
MAKGSTAKIGLEIDAELYAHLSELAERNGQSRRFLLEQALKFYFEAVVPTQGVVRPEVLTHFRKSTAKNEKLLRLLAK